MNKYVAGTILVNHGAGLINHHCVFNPENASAEVGENADAMCLTGVVGGYKEDESIADARRIAASLTVCAGLTTEGMERGVTPTFKDIARIAKQRDRLLVAANNLLYPTQFSSYEEINAIEFLKNLIKEIEGDIK